MIRNIAIILAAGAGERTGFSQPKQLLQLAGRPIVAHTIERFQRHPEIDEIAIVTGASCRTEIERLVIQLQATKTKKVILGGRERYESSLAAISSLQARLITVFLAISPGKLVWAGLLPLVGPCSHDF